MGRIKIVVLVCAILLIGPGFLSVTIGAAGNLHIAPKVYKIVNWVKFPSDGKASYVVDPANGCIEKFYYKNGEPIKPKQPGWLREGKKTVDFGSFTDSKCRQGVIAKGSSPIEYWGYANGQYYCIGVYDPDVPPFWIQPCPP